MTPTEQYLKAELALAGEHGWTIQEHGHDLTATKGDEKLAYYRRFNGGDPKWYRQEVPERLVDALPSRFPCVPVK